MHSGRIWLCLSVAMVVGACADVGGDLRAEDLVAMYRGDPLHHANYDARPVRSVGGIDWMVRTDGPVRSSPTVAGSTVFVGSGDGHVYAIELATGVVRWRFDAAASVTSSPAVHGDIVIATNVRGTIFGIERNSGRAEWSVETGPNLPLPWGRESGDVWSASAVVAGERVYVPTGSGDVLALDPADGSVVWRATLGTRLRSTPAVTDSLLVVGGMDGTVYFLHTERGSIEGRFQTEGASLNSADFGFDRRSLTGSPLLTEDAVYIGGKDGFLYAIDRATLRERWRADFSVSWVMGSLAYADGVVYAGTSDLREVRAFDAATGEEAWRTATAAPVWSSPAIARDLLYVGDASGRVMALDRADGVLRWSFQTDGRIISSPVPADDRVIVGSEDGWIYALRQGPPPRRWVFWDDRYAAASGPFGTRVRDHFAALGYAVIGEDSLMAVLGQAADAPSTIVFASSYLPEAVAAGGNAAPLRRYLEAGGKVVWLGVPPLIRQRDPATGRLPGLAEIRWTATDTLLGVAQTGAIFDLFGARATAAGAVWGLGDEPRLTRWSTADHRVQPLVVDENGRAAAWVRSYGGPPGTGFVHIWKHGIPGEDLAEVYRAAEYRPMSGDASRAVAGAAASSRVAGSSASGTRRVRPRPARYGP